MKYRKAVKSNFLFSEIGFGCMSLGTVERENTRIIHKAMDKGINYFDTADIYQDGMNEIFLGKALAGKRASVYIGTKAGNIRNTDGSLSWNASRKHLLTAAEESLKRLNTDYLDLFLLHGGTLEDNLDDSVSAFELLKQQGKIREYGISSIRPGVIREYLSRSAITMIMMQYSLLDRRPEESCLELAKNCGAGILARGGIAKGLLVNKPSVPFLDYSREDVELAISVIESVSGERRSKAQAALQFVLAHDAVTSAITGIRTMEQLDELVKVSDVPDLTQQEYAKLSQVLTPNVYTQHR